MNVQKWRTIMKSFLTSKFSYCLLIWMCCCRRRNIKISSIHERAPRISYQDHSLTFQELLNIDNAISMHHRNLKLWQRKCLTEILRQTFVSKTSSYNPRRNNTFEKHEIALCISRYWIVFVFRPKNTEFSSSRNETTREPWLLHIKNKEMCALWMSMQNM